MSAVQLYSALRRWRWLVVSIIAVATLSALASTLRTPASYQAHVRLQVTAPDDTNISLVDSGNSSTSTLRDDLTLVQNDFATVAASAEVHSRTVQALGLSGRDTSYHTAVVPVLDSNFVDLQITAPSAALSQSIANTQAAEAIRYYGELRAKPATDTMSVISGELQRAASNVDAAAAASGPAASANLDEARSIYQQLLQKYSEASLAADNAAQATYLQIAEQASPGQRPSMLRHSASTGLLALVGGLGLGALLALVLESLFPRKANAPGATARALTRRVPRSALPTPARTVARDAGYQVSQRVNGIAAVGKRVKDDRTHE